MSEVAAKIGGSKTTLWSYFHSKEGLFAACLEESMASFQSDLSAEMTRAAEGDDALSRFARGLIAKLCSGEGVALQRLIVSDVSRIPRLGSIFYDSGPLEMHAVAKACISRQIDAGRLSETDADEAASVLITLCTGGVRDRALFKAEPFAAAEIDRAAAATVARFLRWCGAGDERGGRAVSGCADKC